MTKVFQVPYLSPSVDFDKKKPDPMTHFAIYTAGLAIGYETRANNLRAENMAEWFTPEVLRAARVFLKDLSTAQYTNAGASKVDKPGFLYYPSELSGIPDEGNRGRWVHLVSLGLQVAQITWAATRKLPFYVRGLLRAVPYALLPEVCTIAALTDPGIEVLMNQHLMLWVRAKSWGECRPFSTTKEMSLGYEDSFDGRLATISVTEAELAEAFLEQEEEYQALPDKPDPLEEGAILAHPAPSTLEKGKKGKGKDKKSNEKGKGQEKTVEEGVALLRQLPFPLDQLT